MGFNSIHVHFARCRGQSRLVSNKEVRKKRNHGLAAPPKSIISLGYNHMRNVTVAAIMHRYWFNLGECSPDFTVHVFYLNVSQNLRAFNVRITRRIFSR